jgi:hypothetical protein
MNSLVYDPIAVFLRTVVASPLGIYQHLGVGIVFGTGDGKFLHSIIASDFM